MDFKRGCRFALGRSGAFGPLDPPVLQACTRAAIAGMLVMIELTCRITSSTGQHSDAPYLSNRI